MTIRDFDSPAELGLGLENIVHLSRISESGFGLLKRQRSFRKHPERVFRTRKPEDVSDQRPAPDAVAIARKRRDGLEDVGVDDARLARRRLPHGQAGDGHLQHVDNLQPVRRQKLVQSELWKQEGQVKSSSY